MRRKSLDSIQVVALGNAVSCVYGAISNVEEEGQNRFSIPQEVINDFYGWTLDPDNYSAQTDDLLQFIIPSDSLSTFAVSSGIDTRQEGDQGFGLDRNIMLYDHDVRNAYAYIFENVTNETRAKLPENFMNQFLQAKNGLNRSALPIVLMKPDDERAKFAQTAAKVQRRIDSMFKADSAFTGDKPNPKKEIRNAKHEALLGNIAQVLGRGGRGDQE